MSYCGICYYFKQDYPFGYCEPCWVKAGRPQKMLGTFITEADPA